VSKQSVQFTKIQQKIKSDRKEAFIKKAIN
jgi:hypothetical protein